MAIYCKTSNSSSTLCRQDLWSNCELTYALDPFQCKCILCVTFWKNVFGSSADLLFDSYKKRMELSSDISIKMSDMVKVGDRVSVHGKSVKSLTNGIYEGKRYFYCTTGHGIMVPYREVVKLQPYVKTPSLNNIMFPSYNQVRKARQEREEILEAFYRSRSTSPKLYSTQNKHQLSRVLTADTNDMAYKDRLQMHRRCSKHEREERQQFEKNMREEKKVLTKLFGTGERAERLEETLKYLQKGYEKGQDEKAQNQKYSLNSDSDNEE
ncbi:hypothetical protein LOTGIDRAFT_229839 [Lottia gigantea]|uniref:Uncharacterized protein n=1 Tax=Lottia gigantea TaxID=225164 RepID=V3ZFJ2_LOTGI|nr:hypothetical protein LOTGIDRAFT_229839 [Lottia gigantea]ESO82837.1 hypothetical protein LOTGIDRAFT_229839 [Lottia gigantea]